MLCRANAARARRLRPDAIVGIPRSGMLPASLLALALHVPLADVRSFCVKRTWARGDRSSAQCTAKRVLLVDDASSFGKTMRHNLALIRRTRPDVEVLTCAVYATPSAVPRFDLAFEALPKPRLFEWNWWRHGRLNACCVDIDGVLYVDPDRRQRRDPALYRRFISEGAPLFRPTKPIGALVTGRRELYRAETEERLARDGIQYGALEMLANGAPKGGASHAEHKATIYRQASADLFIESDASQAELIAKLSGKDALCITTRTMYRALA